jgi:hypothetical protein
MSNINDTFFDGHYKEIWKTLIPDELTVKEVDFMVPHFGLQPGSKVLDLMCGYGRHAIALAKKGIVVTAVDNLGDYIDEISLNFFNAADTIRLFSNIAAHLKPGGHLLINSWSIAEIVFNKPVANSWSKIGEYKFLTEAKLSFRPTRMEMESIMIAPDGTEETKKGIDYIYSLNEMDALLQQAGLHLKEVYSIPGRKKFTVGEPRAYLIAGNY